MKTHSLRNLMVLVIMSALFAACQKKEPVIVENTDSAFIHGFIIEIDGEDYYFSGPTDGPNGEQDIPGHDWRKAGNNKIEGKHYNSGPFGAANWWSSDAADGTYLYFINGVIDIWTPELAENYAANGFVHYHEFVSVATGDHHPSKVIWLKHTAVTSFTLDGGPGAPDPPYQHQVTPGLDWDFPNNYMMPYIP